VKRPIRTGRGGWLARSAEPTPRSAYALLGRGLLGALAFVCAGCGSTPTVFPASAPPADLPPITVAAMDLRPIASLDAQVTASPVFAVLAPSAGVVTGLAAAGETVQAGTAVAVVDGAPVASPVAGVVVGPLADAGQSVPANLPLVAIRYAGFALSGTPARSAQGVLFEAGVTARGQITDGTGPIDCAAIVPSVSGAVVPPSPADPAAPSDPYAGAQAGAPAPASWNCLLPKDVAAMEGQSGVVVASGTVATGVVAVPVTAVAGRSGVGQVSLVTDSGTRAVEVKLGRSDGTNIEITGGLKAGDRIFPIAPDLIAKGPG